MAGKETSIEELQALIDGSDNIVFFGGAGVSTESGIKDFRSVDGLYHQHYKYPPETMLSHTFYVDHRQDFFDFYRDKLLMKGQAKVKPNAAHYKLAELEKAGKLKAIVTQNIDGLHQDAGSETVYELHGSVLRNYCEHCGKFFDVDYMLKDDGVPVCDTPGCSGFVKPDVVLYEEGLDNNIMRTAVQAIANADMLIIGGTSLVVYPAAGLIDYYRGNKLVLINRDATARDDVADYCIHGSIGQILSQIEVR